MRLPWSSEDKTKVVDSLRKRDGHEDDASDRKTVAINKTTGDANDKTMPVRSDNTEITNTEQQRSGRLSWPARDSGVAQRGGGRLEPARPASRDEQTRLYVPGGPSAEGRAPVPASEGLNRAMHVSNTSDDPVVGWLVIIDGPGKGRSFELGFGANSIGRDKGQKVALDFGDAHISREKHALLVYDPKSTKFFLQNGDVRNLTYLADEVVLNPVQLSGREIVTLGGTKLMFVPFCGLDFGWG